MRRRDARDRARTRCGLGLVIPGTYGWRAERAGISALLPVGTASGAAIAAIAKVYDVPIADEQVQMVGWTEEGRHALAMLGLTPLLPPTMAALDRLAEQGVVAAQKMAALVEAAKKATTQTLVAFDAATHVVVDEARRMDSTTLVPAQATTRREHDRAMLMRARAGETSRARRRSS